MSTIRYVLEVIDTESGEDPMETYRSDMPFILPEPGAIICADEGLRLRVSRLEHRFSRDDAGLIQTLRVFVDPVVSPELANRARELVTRLRWKGRDRGTEAESADLSEDDRAMIALDDLLPTVQALWKTHLLSMTRSTVGDVEAMDKAFRATYELLPGAVRVLVSQERFVVFCTRHRDQLLDSDWMKPDEPGEI